MRSSAAIGVFILCAVPAAAQENDDLGRIPGTIASAPAPAPDTTAQGKFFVENALSLSSYRGTFAVPYPYQPASRWADRTSLDALDQWTLAPSLTATVSDRLSASFADGVGFPEESVRNDLREAYLTWEPMPQTYLEAGRINVRNGVAYAFNPTDFFRSRTAVAQASADPSAQRENRLGTFMFRGQRIFDGGTLTVIYAPKLHTPAPLGKRVDWIDPNIDQTNTADRFLASISFEIEDFSPQVLVYHESGRTKFGLNISHPVGDSIIAYASWAGGVAPNLVTDVFRFGERTGTFPAVATAGFPADTSRAFRNQLSLGAAWTSVEKISVTVEYEYNEAGFSKQDWRDWFTTGADPAYSQLAWYVRGYAGDQQQPMSQHQMAVWSSWFEPLGIDQFSLGGFALISPLDGSALGQISGSYNLSDRWSVGLFLSGSTGGRRSEWGSLQSAGSAIFQLVRYI
jgi:hypothetical protein